MQAKLRPLVYICNRVTLIKWFPFRNHQNQKNATKQNI